LEGLIRAPRRRVGMLPRIAAGHSFSATCCAGCT
jgi:hypothetical protein